MLGQLAGREDTLGQGDGVVLQEHHLQAVPYFGIMVDEVPCSGVYRFQEKYYSFDRQQIF